MLVGHLLEQIARRLGREVQGVSAEALGALERHAWPGNVRQLGNELERAVSVARGGPIGLVHLSRSIRGSEPVGPTTDDAPLSLWAAVEQFERDHLRRALEAHDGNVSRAARALGISRVGLQRKMRQLGLREPKDG